MDQTDPSGLCFLNICAYVTDLLSGILGTLTGVVAAVAAYFASGGDPLVAAAVGICSAGAGSVVYHELIVHKLSKLTIGSAAARCAYAIFKWTTG